MFRCLLCRKDHSAPPDRCAGEDLQKETLQALLTEYSCLREEAQHDDTHQIQLVTITFSTLIAIAGAAAAFFSGLPERVSVFLSFVALPCLAMFMGLLWIDLIYRRNRFGCYTKLLENKINALLQPTAQASRKFMEWEHWIQSLEESSGSLGQARFFRGYIVTGSWIAAPFLIMGRRPVFRYAGEVSQHLPRILAGHCFYAGSLCGLSFLLFHVCERNPSIFI